ncbi:MAG: hypothetical protein IT452_09820 [Planctomycetia bacterium]|nr:hypothetical protein [Planctomycetia bacterium]
MAKRFRFLLLDADVVIEVWRRGAWRHLVSHGEITMVETVRDEARFYEDADGNRHEIDLAPDVASGNVKIVSVALAQIQQLIESVPAAWRPDMNPGETASLAWLLSQPSEPAYRLCSADHITFRVLGMKRRSEAGISLEEILAAIGRVQPDLARHFTRKYREDISRQGFADGLQRD